MSAVGTTGAQTIGNDHNS